MLEIKEEASDPAKSSTDTKGAEDKPEDKKKKDFGINLEEMGKVGLHLGHRISRINPKMMPYICGIRNTIHVINLEISKDKLEEALKYIESVTAEGKIILFVGTKIQIKDIVKRTAEECSLPHVTERWLGGTFTNFGTIKKRIEYLKELEEKKAAGELEKYTKKEKLQIDKKIHDLGIKIGGIKQLDRLPDVIFVASMKKDELAVKEARMTGIPVIGIADTNVDPTLADYPIPANDDAISSVKYILEKIKEVILRAKSEIKEPKSE